MKGKLLLIFSFFLIPYFTIAQKVDKENRDKEIDMSPSITITFAPSFFSVPEIGIKSKTFFLNSWHLSGNFFILKRLSFSSGVNALFLHASEEFSIHPENGYSGPVRLEHRLDILSVPFRMNYYILKPNTRMNLYFKIGFNNSFKFRKTENSPGLNGEYGYLKKSGYSKSIDFGFGLDYRVLEKLSVVFEANRSYFISGFLPQYGLLEFQFGIKYKIHKNKFN